MARRDVRVVDTNVDGGHDRNLGVLVNADPGAGRGREPARVPLLSETIKEPAGPHRQQNDGQGIASHDIGGVIVGRTEAVGRPHRTHQIVNDAGYGQAILKLVDRLVEPSPGLRDVLLKILDRFCHPEALSVRTSLSCWSDRAVRVGASDVFDMALRPYSPRMIATTASAPPTMSAARACESTFVASQSTSAWVSQIKARIETTAAAITMTSPMAIVRTLSDISVRKSVNSFRARSADSRNASASRRWMLGPCVSGMAGSPLRPRSERWRTGSPIRSTARRLLHPHAGAARRPRAGCPRRPGSSERSGTRP